MKKAGIIITADDYGLTDECNQGILKAVQRGMVTSVHVMVNMTSEAEMDDLKDAVSDGGHKCGIGLHLNTTYGPSLVQENASFKYRKGLGDRKRFFFKGLGDYAHLNAIRKKNRLKMEKELTTQFQTLSKWVGGDEKIDAISSHHNVHVWDRHFIRIINKLGKVAKIPVRSPVRWVTNNQNPDLGGYKYPGGYGPITKTGIKNIRKIIKSPGTIELMSTGLPMRYKTQKACRDLIVEQGGGLSPRNNSGHWYGQPSLEALEWFMNTLVELNQKSEGYSSEIFTHLSNSAYCSKKPKIDSDWDYKLKKRKEEYDVLTDISTVQKFNALKEKVGILHGSYRTVLQQP
ncbi:MAG: ChbG/HpnK family deacetylase [Flavobacteriales bacterium]|nr:ChbG/HpnK family deacetylase [Flavobacteriales bacterium]